MPVKTFMATYAYSNWDDGSGTVWSEMIKADNLKTAKSMARRISMEMGPDYEMMEVRKPILDNFNRIKGMYNDYLRAERRGRAGILMLASRRRRGNRNYRPIRVQI